SESDPAAAALRPLAAEACGELAFGDGREPSRTSGKIADLIAALGRLGPEWEALVFADSDLLVGPDWLAGLTAPLADPRVGVATAPMFYVPSTRSLASFTGLAWFAAGLPWFSAMQNAAGQSMAVRRADFDAWGMTERWSRVMLEDLPLAAAARAAGRRVEVVGSVLPWAPEDGGWTGLLSLTAKWMTLYKFYDARVWLLGLLLTLFKTYVWTRALAQGLWGLAAAAWAWDALYLAMVVSGLERRLPDRFDRMPRACRPAALWAALCAPLLQAVYAADFLRSAAARRIAWGRRVYRLSLGGAVEVLPRA
ncbi:MAG: hypothetical protein KGL53_07050, partial [Elusimicrobia bacterium]|nr:hypothetical protein [Elusimicrobiota bacterium]